MSTSDERLKIAKKLRLAKGQSELVSAIGIDAYGARWTWNGVSNRIANLVDPTCHVVPFDEESMRLPHCSSCGQPILKPWPNYCPQCGARVVTGDGK